MNWARVRSSRSSSAGLREVEQRVVQFGGVAAGDREQQPPQRGLLQRIQPPDRAEVDERQLAVAQH